MPRPGPRMEMVWARLPPDLIVSLDRMAAAAGATRSEMVRTLLAQAAAGGEKARAPQTGSHS